MTHLEIGEDVTSVIGEDVEDVASVVITLVDFDGGAGVVRVVLTLEVTLVHVLIFPNCAPSVASSPLPVGLLSSVVPLVVIGIVVLFVAGLLVVVVLGGIRGVLLGHFRLLFTGVVARLSLPPLFTAPLGMLLFFWV